MAPSVSDDEPGPAGGAPAQRVVDAALLCFARWGLAKTSLDDVAREAGCSRATVYRLFPGGKGTLVDAVVASELDRLFACVARSVDPETTLEDQLVAGIVTAARMLHGHEALQYLLVHEPDQVLPFLTFNRFGAVLDSVAAFVAPFLAPRLGEELARRTGEWVTRLVVSYALSPSTSFDLTDEADVRRLVTAFVLPGLASSAA